MSRDAAMASLDGLKGSQLRGHETKEDEQEHHADDAPVEVARRVVVHVAKPGGGKVRPEDQPQPEGVDAPEQQERHRRLGEVVLRPRSGEHRAQGELAGQQQTNDGKPIKQRKQAEVGQRAHAFLGNRVRRKAVLGAGQESAHDRLDRQGGDHRREQGREEAAGASSAGRALVQRLRQALQGSVRLWQGGDDLVQSTPESTERARPRGRDGACGTGRGGRRRRALCPQFVGHRLLDGLDQGVELLLRDRLGRCRWRLRKAAARQSQQEDKYYRCP